MDSLTLLTASDDRHFLYLLNATLALRRVSKEVRIGLLDLGIRERNLKLFTRLCPNAEIISPDRTLPHWRQNWTWKIDLLRRAPSRYVLYLDLPNLVALRPIDTLVQAIERQRLLVFDTGLKLEDNAPVAFFARFGLDWQENRAKPVFGAGFIGFDSKDPGVKAALERAGRAAEEGMTLGRSAGETNPAYGPPEIVRDCPIFRADQTVLNLAFLAHFHDLSVADGMPVLGSGGHSDSKEQIFWYARRNPESLSHARRYVLNAASWKSPARLRLAAIYLRIAARHALKEGLARLGLLPHLKALLRHG